MNNFSRRTLVPLPKLQRHADDEARSGLAHSADFIRKEPYSNLSLSFSKNLKQNIKLKQTYTSHFFKIRDLINSYFHFTKLQL
jgi:hypothetical protein